MIDICFDFTSDSPHYWDNYWDNNYGLGGGNCDPDAASLTLRKYHKILWSKKLPNGEFMNLQFGEGSKYLVWNDHVFSSDSIMASFRYRKNKRLIENVMKSLPDYHSFFEDYVHKSYTIGGMIIFPRHKGSINQNRGTNKRISDRWDLTLECIRRFYMEEWSPLKTTLQQDKDYFELFIDFKGYVDYFFLQDCVTDDYSAVNIWLGKGDFNEDPLPKTVEEYLSFIDKEMHFLECRNKRINEYVLLNNK